MLPSSGSGSNRPTKPEKTPPKPQPTQPLPEQKPSSPREQATRLAIDIAFRPIETEGLPQEYLFRRIIYNYRMVRCGHYIDTCNAMLIQIDARARENKPFPEDAEYRKAIMDILIYWQWERLKESKLKPKPEDFRKPAVAPQPVEDVDTRELEMPETSGTTSALDGYIPFDDQSQDVAKPPSASESKRMKLWD